MSGDDEARDMREKAEKLTTVAGLSFFAGLIATTWASIWFGNMFCAIEECVLNPGSAFCGSHCDFHFGAFTVAFLAGLTVTVVLARTARAVAHFILLSVPAPPENEKRG